MTKVFVQHRVFVFKRVHWGCGPGYECCWDSIEVFSSTELDSVRETMSGKEFDDWEVLSFAPGVEPLHIHGKIVSRGYAFSRIQ